MLAVVVILLLLYRLDVWRKVERSIAHESLCGFVSVYVFGTEGHFGLVLMLHYVKEARRRRQELRDQSLADRGAATGI